MCVWADERGCGVLGKTMDGFEGRGEGGGRYCTVSFHPSIVAERALCNPIG